MYKTHQVELVERTFCLLVSPGSPTCPKRTSQQGICNDWFVSEASKEEDLRGCLGCLREGDSPATNTEVGGGGAAPLWGGSHGSTIAGLVYPKPGFKPERRFKWRLISSSLGGNMAPTTGSQDVGSFVKPLQIPPGWIRPSSTIERKTKLF